MVRIEQTVLGQTVVLDRPERRNALTLELWQELAALVRRVDSDDHDGASSDSDGTGREGSTDGASRPTAAPPLYVVGAGGYFCSGADLDSLRWARESPEQADVFVEAVVACLLGLHVARREVVALVEGGAAGGGVEIMAAADRRVAIGGPALVFPFGTHGMQLDGFTRWRLHGLVGDREAERLVDGRHVVPTEEALALGLFDERHDSLEAFASAERARLGAQDGQPGEEPDPAASLTDSYLTAGDSLTDAVRRAAAPMREAFPPHTDR